MLIICKLRVYEFDSKQLTVILSPCCYKKNVQRRRQGDGQFGLRLAAIALVPRNKHSVLGEVLVVLAVHRGRGPGRAAVNKEQHRLRFGGTLDFHLLLHAV